MKKHGPGIAIAILGFSQICSAALIAEWKFDDSGNLGKDNVGSFDLTTTSGQVPPTYDAGGRVGGAASFTNSCELATPAGIYPEGDFTFSGWFKPADTEFVNAVRSYSGRGGFQLYAYGGTWRARLFKQDATYDYKVGPAIVADEWVHIALYYNATSGPDEHGNYTGTFRMWVNGENIGGINNAEYAAPTSYTMHMGDRWGDYRGLMDEVQMYDTPLSGEEIEALAAVPEPSSLSMLGIVSAGILWMRRRFFV